jgi:hypothetical protein
MKKIFTYSIAAALVAILFTSCVKERVVYDNDNSSYWLSQERGDVIYSNNYCGYYVVETNYGYTIIQNLDGLRTYDADVMYGNFAGYGTRNFYNYSADLVTSGHVVEYDLSYNEALDAINYYCPVGAKGLALKQSATAKTKMKRPAASVKK